MSISLQEALDRVLDAHRRYYTVTRRDPAAPFAAEAVFEQHDERYFISRNIRLSESDAKESVFFAAVEELGADSFRALDETAWNEGLSRVRPGWSQRGSDITLIILTNVLDPEASDLIRSANRTKSYAFSFKGWSNYCVIAIEVPTGNAACNRLGRQRKESLCKIINASNK